MPIPAHLFFVWYGRAVPLFAELAVKSALLQNPNARVSFWYSEELEAEARVRLSALPRVQLRPIDVPQLLAAVAELGKHKPKLDVVRLQQAYAALTSPAARANVVRLLVLYAEGGVYLDTDTLSLRGLEPLLELPGFCGQEHILWPKHKLRKDRPYFWLGGPLLMASRALLGKLPRGYLLHRRLLEHYSLAANNAVLGFPAGHGLVGRALERITLLEPSEWTRRFRLGTHLLQEVLEEAQTDPALGSRAPVVALAPEHFYPLGPVISEHYFRQYPDARAVWDQIPHASTYVIHWYASVSDLQALDAAYIRAHAQHTVFAALCAPLLDARIV